MNLSLEKDISKLEGINDGYNVTVTVSLANPVPFADLKDISICKDSKRFFDLPGKVQAKSSRGLVSSFTWSSESFVS